MPPFDRANKVKTISGSGAQTDKEIVAAVTNKRIHAKRFVFTASAAATLTVNSRTGSTNTPIIKMLNTTNAVLEGFDFLKTKSGEALVYTTSTGDSEVYVEYTEG